MHHVKTVAALHSQETLGALMIFIIAAIALGYQNGL